MKLLAQRAGLPGNVDMIAGSALTPLRESVSALPASRSLAEGRRFGGGRAAPLPVSLQKQNTLEANS
jgi:hypothetical protein